MNEDSDIIYEIENKIIPIIESNKINNIKIIYSKGINCFSNNLKEIKMLNLIDIINQKYTSKPIYYEHSISCS
jgi:F0F1-type ATP synthase gamma subunit